MNGSTTTAAQKTVRAPAHSTALPPQWVARRDGGQGRAEHCALCFGGSGLGSSLLHSLPGVKGGFRALGIHERCMLELIERMGWNAGRVDASDSGRVMHCVACNATHDNDPQGNNHLYRFCAGGWVYPICRSCLAHHLTGSGPNRQRNLQLIIWGVAAAIALIFGGSYWAMHQ